MSGLWPGESYVMRRFSMYNNGTKSEWTPFQWIMYNCWQKGRGYYMPSTALPNLIKMHCSKEEVIEGMTKRYHKYDYERETAKDLMELFE